MLVIEALRDDRKGVKIPAGSYYSIKEKYEITAIAGVTEVSNKHKIQFLQLKLTII